MPKLKNRGERHSSPTGAPHGHRKGRGQDEAARGIARHFQIRELEMVRPTVDAFADGVGRAI